MRRCIYCRKFVEQSTLTLEHVIPQFLGGAYAPDWLKTRDVCRRCNSNLGLFVDASFEKDWSVSSTLAMAAHKTYDASTDVGLPLICMGLEDVPLPGLQPDECCEVWLGPSGERVFWIRPADESLYWYMGGNPITAKTARTRAYFMFSVRSHTDPWRTLHAFKAAFVGRKVKKVVGTAVEGIDMKSLGFSEPDDLDFQRIAFLFNYCEGEKAGKGGFSMYVHHATRFLAKLAIGTAYCLFGERALKTDYAEELYRALVFRPEGDAPGMLAVPNFGRPADPYMDKMMGIEGCVTIAITASPEGVLVNLNIDSCMNWLVKCADVDGLDCNDLDRIGVGKVLVLSRQLQSSVDLPMTHYIAHKNGNIPNEFLQDVESRVAASGRGRRTDVG